MVTIPKNSVLTNPASVSGPKGLPNTRISSLAETSVEFLDGSTGVTFDNSAFDFNENSEASLSDGKDNDLPFSQPNGKDTLNKDYKSILQGMDIPRALSEQIQTGPIFSVPYVGLLAKAIAIYENNARIFNGETSIRGTTFSVIL
jgi:hypothetical protein